MPTTRHYASYTGFPLVGNCKALDEVNIQQGPSAHGEGSWFPTRTEVSNVQNFGVAAFMHRRWPDGTELSANELRRLAKLTMLTRDKPTEPLDTDVVWDEQEQIRRAGFELTGEDFGEDPFFEGDVDLDWPVDAIRALMRHS